MLPCLQFNLEVDEVPAAAQHISAWRQEPGGIRAPLQLEASLLPAQVCNLVLLEQTPLF